MNALLADFDLGTLAGMLAVMFFGGRPITTAIASALPGVLGEKWNFFVSYLYNLVEMVCAYRIPNAGRF